MLTNILNVSCVFSYPMFSLSFAARHNGFSTENIDGDQSLQLSVGKHPSLTNCTDHWISHDTDPEIVFSMKFCSLGDDQPDMMT